MSPAIAHDRLSSVFAALADPTRREILGQLSRGVASVTDLARPHKMSLPAISKHLRVLERSGLIERGRRAQWRPCRIRAKPLKEAVDWIGQYREHWEQSFQRLDVLLEEMKAAEAKASTKTKP
jgi:DNA-binding transcriptional ArsR family regulator